MTIWVAVQFKIKKELDLWRKTYDVLRASLSQPPEIPAALPLFSLGVRQYESAAFTLSIGDTQTEVASLTDLTLMCSTPLEAADGWDDHAIEALARDTYQTFKEKNKNKTVKRKKALLVEDMPLFDFIPAETEKILLPESETIQELVLYTVGHSSLSLENFVQMLQKNQIGLLVDVRSQPYSRYSPHFNRENLKPGLEQLEIGYRFAGEYLGGRPTDPIVYKNHQLPDKGTERHDFLQLVDYQKVMEQPWYQKGIRALIKYMNDMAQQETYVAIMCSEGHPHECHRHHLITRSLVDPNLKINHNINVQVRHILKGGFYQIVTTNDFEQVEQHQQVTLL